MPSMTDCIFIVLIVWLFIASSPGWGRLLGDGDTGWHIRVGESILRTGSVRRPIHFHSPSQMRPGMRGSGSRKYCWR